MATSTSTRVTGARLPKLPVLVALVLLTLAVPTLACSPQHGTIGAMLGQQGDGRVFVREVPAGLAADRAGLREGDEILLIEGRDVRTMTEQDLHRALGGEVGDPVRLTLLRGDDVIRVTLERTAAPRPTKASDGRP